MMLRMDENIVIGTADETSDELDVVGRCPDPCHRQSTVP